MRALHLLSVFAHASVWGNTEHPRDTIPKGEQTRRSFGASYERRPQKYCTMSYGDVSQRCSSHFRPMYGTSRVSPGFCRVAVVLDCYGYARGVTF